MSLTPIEKVPPGSPPLQVVVGLTNGKFCSQCTYLLGVRHNFESANDKWRCNHLNNINKKEYDLVTGQLITKHKVDSLYVLRASEKDCGPSGTWYEEYVKPNFIDQVKAIVPAASRKSLRNISADDL